jgi:hypothetical protein
MDIFKSVLDNYELLEEEILDISTVERLLKDWKCQNIHTSANVESADKNTRLFLVK